MMFKINSTTHGLHSVKFFFKICLFYFGYFDPVYIYVLLTKINNFRVELSDISALKASLATLNSLPAS